MVAGGQAVGLVRRERLVVLDIPNGPGYPPQSPPVRSARDAISGYDVRGSVGESPSHRKTSQKAMFLVR